MSQSEIDAVLDGLELDNQELEQSIEVEEPKVEKTKPPGFKTYDEWIALGKDPADYKGENAYNAEYERIQEIRELKGTMSQVVETMSEWKARQVAETRAQIMAELEQAKLDEDVDGALAANEKLRRLGVQAAPVNPVISRITAQNAIIDPTSKQYDKEFHEDVVTMHNSNLDMLLGGNRERAGELTEGQIERSLNLAINRAKLLHPTKFKSPKNDRGTPPGSGQRKYEGTSDSLRSIAGNSRNQRDQSPAMDIYEMLKKKDPKAAEQFKQTMTGAKS